MEKSKKYIDENKITRDKLSNFLDELTVEINLPKTTLLESFDTGSVDEQLLILFRNKMGIGFFPNKQNAEDCIHKLCNFIRAKASNGAIERIKCKDILSRLGIIVDYCGITEEFPVNKDIIIDDPERVDLVLDAVKKNNKVLVVGNPGSGKSWLVNNIENVIKNDYVVIKHYCYTDLKDQLLKERIKADVFLGSLLNQLEKNKLLDSNLFNDQNFAANIDKLNKALCSINKPVLIIIDGLDHIHRIFEQNLQTISKNEIEIINVIGKIKTPNENIKILVFSQPNSKLDILSDFHKLELPKVKANYVEKLLNKHGVENIKKIKFSLADKIYKKADGNPLFISYLIKECKNEHCINSFNLIDGIPDYDFNLEKYYSYIISKFNSALDISKILCYIDYPVTSSDLKEIANAGDYIDEQIDYLLPVLNFSTLHGYSIYHESYKRFILKELQNKKIPIKQDVLPRLIGWLEKKDFYSDIKAYTYLLDYYQQHNDYLKIEKHISNNFLYESISNILPIETIKNNLKLLLQSYTNIKNKDFKKEIILIHQSKVLARFDDDYGEGYNADLIGSLILASTKKFEESRIYNFIYPNAKLAFDIPTTYQIFKYLYLNGFKNLIWEILPEYNQDLQDVDIGCIVIRLLAQEKYCELSSVINKCIATKKSQDFLLDFFDSIESYYLLVDASIIKKCPIVVRLYYSYFRNSHNSFYDLLESVLKCYYLYEEWRTKENFIKLLWATRRTSEIIINEEIDKINQRFWFVNWIIFSIKIVKLSQRNYSWDELLSAFSLLIVDLEPFKGKPRACDLHCFENIIHKTFHIGLKLCRNESELRECLEILKKVTETQTFLNNCPFGPLTTFKYFEMKSFYLPKELIISNFNIRNEYKNNGSYNSISKIMFRYAYLFKKDQSKESEKYFCEGIKAMLSVGNHKDYILTDLLLASSEYQNYTCQLTKNDFFKLEKISYLMQMHTDGKDVWNYPKDWFEIFHKFYPEESLKYLISKMINTDGSYVYNEEDFQIFLENEYSTQEPNLWFLLWLSLPQLTSDKMLLFGLKLRNRIDEELRDFFDKWMIRQFNILLSRDINQISKSLRDNFENIYGLKIQKNDKVYSSSKIIEKLYKTFEAKSYEEALEYFELLSYNETMDLENIQKYIMSLVDFDQKKKIIIKIVKKLEFKHLDKEDIPIILNVKSDEYIYFNTALFVFTNNGGYSVLTNFEYLENAYNINKSKTLNYLKDIIAIYINNNFYALNYKLLGNLIASLIKLKIKENKIAPLFNELNDLIVNQFPDLVYESDKKADYNELNDYSYNELLIILLLCRLKTLTGERNRNVILGIKYLADADASKLVKPYSYIFSNSNAFLPSQRAVLLQILYESKLEDEFYRGLNKILKLNYPTYYFVEDYYIKKICDSDNNKVLLPPPKRLVYPISHRDVDFLIYWNERYSLLIKKYGVIEGLYDEYQKNRRELSEKYSNYQIEPEGICVPMVSYQDIAYQIVSQRLYQNFFHSSNSSNFDLKELRFEIENSIRNITSLDDRPNFLLFPNEINSNCAKAGDYCDNNWVLVGSAEVQYVSKDDYKREEVFATIRLCSDSSYPQPLIIKKDIEEINKYYSFYLSDFLIKKFTLILNSSIYCGNYYCKNNDIVAKSISWKKDYMGSTSDGFELPQLDGTAFLIRKDLFLEILDIYQGKLILMQNCSKF